MILLFVNLIPLLAALVLLLVKKNSRLLEIVSLFSSSLIFILSVLITKTVLANQVFSFSSWLSVGSLAVILLLLITFIGLLASFYSIGYLRAEVAKGIIGFSRVRQYFILLNIFFMTMVFAVTTANPILTWIAIEATTLSTAFLISFYNKSSSMEAAWKYLVINSVGLLLALFGTVLFLSPFASTGHFELLNWTNVLQNASTLNPAIAKIAFVFVLIGYGTKMGLAPMHTWLPDAHSKAPVPISSLLSGVLLNIALFAILRFKLVADVAMGNAFTNDLLIYFGLFSIVLSALLIYLQVNYKRLLAYSTIEHMGIIALGIGFGGLGIFAAFLHLIYHSLAKPLLFLASGNIFLKYGSTKMPNIKGLLKVIPATAVLFLFGLLVITGVPPFGMFLTELSILTAGIKSHPIIVAIVLCALALVFIGFLRHATDMIYTEKPESMEAGEVNYWNLAPIIILAIVIIFLSFYLPEPVKTLINRATLIY